MKSKLTKIFTFLIILILVAVIAFLCYIFINTRPVDKNNKEYKTIVIETGTSRMDIAKQLKRSGIIRNYKIFYYYAKLKKVNNIYAATYRLSPSMDIKEVLKELEKGGTNTNTTFITFKEGINMVDVANIISENTSNTKEDVFNKLKDTEYLDKLIEKYWFIDEIIKNPNIYYSLEGYLYPETYNIDKDFDVEQIFEVMLNETDKVLSKHKKEIEKGKYSVHEILTLASIIETESNDKSSRGDVASVFYNRLNSSMSLGSDVTTYYGARIAIGSRDLTYAELNSQNAYNTRASGMIGKLPIGPISMPSSSSIEAAIKPNKTDYLFFVADKNGKIYFTKTESEHNKVIKELQDKGLWYEW